MIQEIAQIEEIEFHHIDPLVLDHFAFHAHEIIFDLDFVIILENSPLTEKHHVQDLLNFKNNEETLDLPFILPPETIVCVLFLDPFHRNWQYSRNNISTYGPLWRARSGFTSASRRFVNNLQEISPEKQIFILNSFQSQKTYLKSICIPLKWEML